MGMMPTTSGPELSNKDEIGKGLVFYPTGALWPDWKPWP